MMEQTITKKTRLLETITGEQVRLSRYSSFHLEYVIECGSDLVAQIRIADGAIPANNRGVRVYASKHPGVSLLIQLAHERGELRLAPAP